MPPIQLGLLVVNSITMIVIATYAYQTKILADETTTMAKATKRAHLKPNLLLYTKPYGRSGLMNVVLENTGSVVAEDVEVKFPKGFNVSEGEEIKDLSQEYTVLNSSIDTFSPGQSYKTLPFRIAQVTDKEADKISPVIPYEIKYRAQGEDKFEKVDGVINLNLYKGTAVREYTDLEDLRKELLGIKKELEK